MNIEFKVINYLKETLETDRVYGEKPDSPEGEFFVVDKTGSSIENRITTSTLAIQSYGPNKARASELNEILKAAMDLMPREKEIGACKLLSDYNYTNIAKKEHRYQAVFNITHY